MDNIFKEVYNREWKNDVYTIYQLTKSHIPRLTVAILCGLVVSVINGAIAWLVKPSLDSLFIEKNKMLIFFIPLGAFLLFTLRGVFIFCNNFLMSSVGAKLVKALRQGVYKKILRLPIEFHTKKTSASIISRLLNDINILENHIATTSKNFFVQTLTVLFLACVALYRRWDLALLSFIVIPFVVLVSDRFGRGMKNVSMRTRLLISDVTKVIHETLSGMRVISAFTMEKEMLKRNEYSVSNHYRNVMREVRINEFTTIFIEIIAGSGVAIILWYGSYLIVNDRLSVGSFFSFVAAILMIYTPLKRLSKLNNNFQMIRTALQRIREIFMVEEEIDGKLKKEKIKGHIICSNLSFSYPESKESALNNINLEIMPGETVAIVGHSGAGKTTLTDLLLGFWKDFTGEILIDGNSINEYSLSNLRSHMGIVYQDIILFDDTVKNNILFGKPDATDDEIITAANAANAHEFIINLPQGYETNIGEQGIKLSGGQKQRISLARAIIKNPAILMLDEATSSLDTVSEIMIQRALGKLLKNRTNIVIAHRLSTIRKADRIIVMDRGRILESGTHSELIEKGHLYKKLYDLQFIDSEVIKQG